MKTHLDSPPIKRKEKFILGITQQNCLCPDFTLDVGPVSLHICIGDRLVYPVYFRLRFPPESVGFFRRKETIDRSSLKLFTHFVMDDIGLFMIIYCFSPYRSDGLRCLRKAVGSTAQLL